MAQQFGLRRVEPRSPDATPASAALLAAAERDAGEIVASARAEVQRTILRAQQELLALNAQVRTTLERLDGRDERREQGRAGGGPFAASQVLTEAHAQLDALSIDAGRTGVVVAHPATQVTLAAPAVALSPYEKDNARVRVKVPFRAARRLRVVPAVAISLAAALMIAGWAWTRGSLPAARSTEVRPTSEPASDDVRKADGPSEPSSEATGMIGRNPKGGRGEKPERAAAARRAAVPPTESPALLKSIPAAQSTSPVARQELLIATERWLDAYYLQDAGRMAAISTPAVTLSDERTSDERLPRGLSGVRRTLSDATVQVFGTDAILTAKINERSDVSGQESASFISQMWTRRGGVWQVTDVRIVSAAAVARAFKR
jgi:hypothetical protein